jgi:ribosomal protein S18 acetylase RimI-like enzyme
MSEYILRNATKDDIPYLANVVIGAEKGNSNKLSYSTFFNLSEEQVRSYIIRMFEEEVDGCEFSLSSYLLYEYEGNPVASVGGWIEGFGGEVPSKILKSNLIAYTFNPESLEFVKTKSDLIKEFQAEREPMTLQIEYCYLSRRHRGIGLAENLFKRHQENAISAYPAIKKAQVQVFKINTLSIRLCESVGFKIARTYKSSNKEILNYLPSDEKCILEKELQ